MSRLVGEQQEREENLRQRIRGLQESLRAARAENSIMSPPQVALGSGTMSCVCACDVMCTSLVRTSSFVCLVASLLSIVFLSLRCMLTMHLGGAYVDTTIFPTMGAFGSNLSPQ